MDLPYPTIGLCMSNPTTPLFDWNKGSAFELDMFRAKPKMQAIHMEIGTDMVIFTMAARTTQMLLSLAKMVKSQMHWKWPLVDWMGRASRAVMWMCRVVLGPLVGMDSAVSGTYYWKDLMESPALNPTAQEEKVLSPTSVMLPIQDIQLVTLDWNCDGQGSMEPNKEATLTSCTNPIILSMVYLPSDNEDASRTSEASEINELDEENEQLWEDKKESCSTENNKAMDSGMQEPQAPGSKVNTEESDWSNEESDWSDEESWDSSSNAESSKLDEELWESFCQSDDPYNPLCFAMPTKSPKKTHEPKDITGATGGSVTYSVLLGESGTKKHTPGQRENPCIEQSYHSRVNEELLESSNNSQEQKRSHNKHVHFSTSVTVHHMVVWSYAHRMARRGSWEEYARDHCRFQRRIAETEAAIGLCIEPQHREKIWARLQKSSNM